MSLYVSNNSLAWSENGCCCFSLSSKFDTVPFSLWSRRLAFRSKFILCLKCSRNISLCFIQFCGTWYRIAVESNTGSFCSHRWYCWEDDDGAGRSYSWDCGHCFRFCLASCWSFSFSCRHCERHTVGPAPGLTLRSHRRWSGQSVWTQLTWAIIV